MIDDDQDDPLSNDHRQALRRAALEAGDDVGFPGTSEYAERFAIVWSPEVCLLILTELERRL